MIKVQVLHELLETKEEDLEHLDTEKLRVLIGTLRYLTRVAERELNHRGEDIN